MDLESSFFSLALSAPQLPPELGSFPRIFPTSTYHLSDSRRLKDHGHSLPTSLALPSFQDSRVAAASALPPHILPILNDQPFYPGTLRLLTLEQMQECEWTRPLFAFLLPMHVSLTLISSFSSSELCLILQRGLTRGLAGSRSTTLASLS